MEFAFFNLMAINHPAEPPAEILANAVRQVQLAEALGFDATWFAEHHFSSASVCCSPVAMAMHCAAVTKRIRLGPAVVVLPLHHPLRVAQELAMLDALSSGRLILGLGPGHQPHEFRSFGVPIAARHEIMDEGWTIIEQALTRRRVDIEGQHFTIRDTPVAMGTLSGAMPPLYIASSAPPVLARAARAGATPLISPGFRTPDQALPMQAAIAEAYRAAGAPADPPKLGIQRYVFVTEDRAEAEQAARGLLHLGRTTLSLRDETPGRDGVHLHSVPFKGEPTVDWLLEHALIGSPEKVAAQFLHEMRVLRPSHYSLYMGFSGLPFAAVDRAIERFGREVLPLLRGAAAAKAAA